MYLIAEIGFNHEGDIELAQKMIQAASDNGADAVKFQTFQARDIALPTSAHYDLIKQGELTENQHTILFETAMKSGVDFLSTPFSDSGVKLLDKIGVSAFKVASMDCTNKPLLKQIARTGKPVYISTGMAELYEIAQTLHFLETSNCSEVTLLHCISHYPAKAEELNLSIIPYLESIFNVPIGYSDHFPGVYACIAAAMQGAAVIETHFTMDKTLPGGDHGHSADPRDLKHLKNTLELFRTMAGSKDKIFNRPDRPLTKDFRRGVYAAEHLTAGSRIEKTQLFCTRPESDFNPDDMEYLEGRILTKNIPVNQPVTRDALE